MVRKKTTPLTNSASNAVGNNVPTPSPKDLDQVRDLLFGPQLKTIDSRLNGLDEQLHSDLARVAKESAEQLGTLERHATSELKRCNERIREEAQLRADANTSLKGELDKATRAIEKRIENLDGRMVALGDSLRDQIRDNIRTAVHDLTQRLDEVRAENKKAIARIEDEKLGRVPLAGLLRDVAECLDQTDSEELKKLVTTSIRPSH